MRFDIYESGRSVGTVRWEGPGEVRLDVEQPGDREFLGAYFAGEIAYLPGGIEERTEGLHPPRRDWSPWEFQKACMSLSRYGGYRIIARPRTVADRTTDDRAAAAEG